MGKRNKPVLSKHDLVRGIKELTMQLGMLHRHVALIDNVVNNYIHMNKDEDKLKKYMEKIVKKEQKLENEQNPEHKQSGRSAKTSK